jgi:hypothetical protein
MVATVACNNRGGLGVRRAVYNKTGPVHILKHAGTALASQYYGITIRCHPVPASPQRELTRDPALLCTADSITPDEFIYVPPPGGV